MMKKYEHEGVCYSATNDLRRIAPQEAEDILQEARLGAFLNTKRSSAFAASTLAWHGARNGGIAYLRWLLGRTTRARALRKHLPIESAANVTHVAAEAFDCGASDRLLRIIRTSRSSSELMSIIAYAAVGPGAAARLLGVSTRAIWYHVNRFRVRCGHLG